MYIVEAVKETESMKREWIIKFETKEALEEWLLHKGFVDYNAIWKAEPVKVTPETVPAQRVVGYKIELR